MRAALVVYVLAMTAWTYLVLDVNVDRDPGWVLILVALLDTATGFVIRRWSAVLLAFVPGLLAVPAGYPGSDFHDPLPLWFGLLLAAPASLVPIGIGVAAGRWHASLAGRR